MSRTKDRQSRLIEGMIEPCGSYSSAREQPLSIASPGNSNTARGNLDRRRHCLPSCSCRSGSPWLPGFSNWDWYTRKSCRGLVDPECLADQPALSVDDSRSPTWFCFLVGASSSCSLLGSGEGLAGNRASFS